MGCHALVQGIFPIQGLNQCFLRLLHRQVCPSDNTRTTWEVPSLFLNLDSVHLNICISASQLTFESVFPHSII